MEMFSLADCSIQQIHELKVHATGEEAMVAFCKLNLAKPVRWKLENAMYAKKLYAFYVFSSPLSLNGTYTHGKYGANFRKFIEDNKLGTVWESPAVKNDIFHPDHANRIWIWMPDNDAVRAWWEKKQKEVK
jgi:hypothetical protein